MSDLDYLAALDLAATVAGSDAPPPPGHEAARLGAVLVGRAPPALVRPRLGER